MKIAHWLVGAVAVLTPFVAAQADSESETFRYESDIARLRSLVIHSLYSHKDVFLRELLSNANDALEKLRITALTDRDVMRAGEANVTIEVALDEGGKTGQLVIRDTGIGMSKDELARNLGTIARSGTNEFLKRADETGGADGNLIGQFGLGFYSCFLVSPTVRVSSLPPPSPDNPEPVQHTFVSSASGDTFEVFPDPRGNTLGRGTEIVLTIPEEEQEWLSTNRLKALIDKHSTFSTTFPIYIKERTKYSTRKDDHEDAESEDDHVWVHVNDKPPLWMRDPKDVTDDEYKAFYKAVAKDGTEPLGWSHFKGDTQSGVSFRAIMYIPSTLPKDFWQKMTSGINNVRLMVKRVFITDNLGDEYMPRWLSFVKITVDADDLPLNVSRETLQNHQFLKQLRRILVRKALDLFGRLAESDPARYRDVSKLYGNALRIGMLESEKDKIKIAKLLRFQSTHSDWTSLEEYVANRKEGQKQIYYIAGVGEKAEDLARSPFVEKLKARGYEVLLLSLPSDEPMMGALNYFGGMKTQDVSKKGLVYGDEDEDRQEKKELEAQKIAFRPLIDALKAELGSQVSDVVLTNRLVTSPCTIVVDSHGWSANMARVMAAQAEAEDDPMFELMKNLPRVLEINPKSPLIAGLLDRALDGADIADETRVLFDTALVRSGFSVKDPVAYFDRIEALLRRSLGVDLAARADDTVRPAPPTAVGPLPDVDEEAEAEAAAAAAAAGGGDPFAGYASGDMMDGADFVDWAEMKRQLAAERGGDAERAHDEL
ncbi:hypothetical protein Q5752_001432 [Cryptotrichosporon argae]